MINHRNESAMTKLPKDMLEEILHYLTSDDLSVLSLTCKFFYTYHVSALNITLKELIAYQNDCKYLQQHEKALFLATRLSKLTELDNLKYHHLSLFTRKNLTLLKCAQRQNHQPVLNRFYSAALEKYTQDSTLDYNAIITAKSILDWAILTKQNSAVLEDLIRHGAIVHGDAHRDAPLLTAASIGHIEAIEVLLNHGVSINQATYFAYGYLKPIEVATKYGRLDSLKFLLQKGACMTNTDGSYSILRTAISNNQPGIIEWLMQTYPHLIEHEKNHTAPRFQEKTSHHSIYTQSAVMFSPTIETSSIEEITQPKPGR